MKIGFGPRRGSRGLTLIEVIVTVMIVAIAVTSALELTATHRRASQLAEERRTAYQAAVAKVDQMRVVLANGVSLDGIFQLFGPLTYVGVESPADVDTTTGDVTSLHESGSGEGTPAPPATGGTMATFAVGEDANNNGALDPGEDLNSNNILDQYLTPLNDRPTGTVVLITTENPEEGDYGMLYGAVPDTYSSNWTERNPFGVDINGNGALVDGPAAATTAAPFPLDLNGNGNTTDSDLIDGFEVLPVVIVIQWQGPYGPERIDHFALLTKETP